MVCTFVFGPKATLSPFEAEFLRFGLGGNGFMISGIDCKGPLLEIGERDAIRSSKRRGVDGYLLLLVADALHSTVTSAPCPSLYRV